MTQRRKRIRTLAAMCVICTIICFLVFLFCIPLKLQELRAKDLLISTGSSGADPRLAFIGIDKPSYADAISPVEAAESPALAHLTNSFPWSREVWAFVADRLVNAGAKVVVFDIVFASQGPGDEALRKALDRYGDHIVIGANFVGGNKVVGESRTILLPSDSVLNAPNGIPIWSDARVGFVNFFSDIDDDDIMRRAVFRVTGTNGLPPNGTMHSLAARALEKFGAGNMVPAGNDSHLFRFSDAPGFGYPLIPLYDIFLPEHWTNNYGAGAFFKDKIVIVGPAANIFHDELRTSYPGMPMLGPEIHLNVIGAALRGEFLGETSDFINRLLVLGGGGLAFLMGLAIRSPLRRLIGACLVIVAYVTLWWALFHYVNFFLLVVTPVLSLGSSTLLGFTYDFVLLRAEKNRTRRTLERYVSKDVVRELLDNPQTFLDTLVGKRKPVTVLFSDVRGFTSMTENADAELLVTQLNEYFKEMVAIVFVEHGSLDKFIGDAVMALWGSITTEGVERDAQHAVAAALAMRRALARLNVNWEQRGMKPLAFGIGINHGEVIVGNLGSEEKMEVSVIGDPVNLGSRLEGSTKQYKLDLLLGESMVPLVEGRFVLRSVDSIQVSGKTKPVHVFTVVADKQAGEPTPSWLARYEEGIGCYRSRRFVDGLAAFADCVREAPEDNLSQLYLHRCQELVTNPPGADWDTVFVMKSK